MHGSVHFRLEVNIDHEERAVCVCRNDVRLVLDVFIDAGKIATNDSTVEDLFVVRDTRMWTPEEATEVRRHLEMPNRDIIDRMHERISYSIYLRNPTKGNLFVPAFTRVASLCAHAKALGETTVIVHMTRPSTPDEDEECDCSDE
ncbi:hypothetical protein QKT49_gp135 [Acanthamoeba castellanii medusavirus]|uniref:Uncharacterized protein n=1 Tax=Acanthamoeba castellanii medusavirus J1 TaxID=3114988 RepID=A0A3T1CWU2_9VIRU|nr:hypothetical protein QKT49_gp135 [Acanthamoeba castellanii medusavirus]BBI30275.1 hypothetical protein [Acanthamoeba castellanii medusavirus J1]